MDSPKQKKKMSSSDMKKDNVSKSPQKPGFSLNEENSPHFPPLPQWSEMNKSPPSQSQKKETFEIPEQKIADSTKSMPMMSSSKSKKLRKNILSEGDVITNPEIPYTSMGTGSPLNASSKCSPSPELSASPGSPANSPASQDSINPEIMPKAAEKCQMKPQTFKGKQQPPFESAFNQRAQFPPCNPEEMLYYPTPYPGLSQSHLPSNMPKNAFNEPTLDMFNKMIKRESHCFLGRTGLKVSRICLGTMNFGAIDNKFGCRPGQLEPKQAFQLLDRFVELGGNFIETADYYPWFGSCIGESETILGNWLSKQVRERIIVMTKIRMPTDIKNVNANGLSRNHIIQGIDASLKRLKTSYIDILQICGWDETVSVYETLRHLDDMIKLKKISYIGVCDMKGWQLQKFIDAAKILNMHKCCLYEGQYNLLSRGVEYELADVCRNEKVGFVAYSPLNSGYLTPQYIQNLMGPVQGSRIEAASGNNPNLVAMADNFTEMLLKDANFIQVMQACAKISKKCSPNLRQNQVLTIPQIAILWLLQKGVVTSVCIGCSNIKELEEDMMPMMGNLSLTNNEMKLLNKASSVPIQYPYNAYLTSIVGYKMINAARSSYFEQMARLSNYVQIPPSMMPVATAPIITPVEPQVAPMQPKPPKLRKKNAAASSLMSSTLPEMTTSSLPPMQASPTFPMTMKGQDKSSSVEWPNMSSNQPY